jgi:hypothetical protein
MPTKADLQAELDALKAHHQIALMDLGLVKPPRKLVTVTYEVDGPDFDLNGTNDDDDWIGVVDGQVYGVNRVEAKVEDAA